MDSIGGHEELGFLTDVVGRAAGFAAEPVEVALFAVDCEQPIPRSQLFARDAGFFRASVQPLSVDQSRRQSPRLFLGQEIADEDHTARRARGVEPVRYAWILAGHEDAE